MFNNIGTHDGVSFWINLEPCGLFCGSMTWFLLIYGMFATSYCIIIPWLGYQLHGLFHLIAFNSLSIIAIYSHIRGSFSMKHSTKMIDDYDNNVAMTTDPGAVPRNAKPLLDDEQEIEFQTNKTTPNLSEETSVNEFVNNRNNLIPFKKYCRRCKAFKPKRAHHCSICGRCIIKMDHHCPWVNNCVGVGNHKLFLLFVFYVMIVCGYSTVLTIGRFVTCWLRRTSCGTATQNLLIIFLMIESALFGLFTLCMLADQLYSMQSNRTQIDRLKNQSAYLPQNDVGEVCGAPLHVSFEMSWLYPIPVHFQDVNIRSKVLGYRLMDQSECSEELFPSLKKHEKSNGSHKQEEGMGDEYETSEDRLGDLESQGGVYDVEAGDMTELFEDDPSMDLNETSEEQSELTNLLPVNNNFARSVNKRSGNGHQIVTINPGNLNSSGSNHSISPVAVKSMNPIKVVDAANNVLAGLNSTPLNVSQYRGKKSINGAEKGE